MSTLLDPGVAAHARDYAREFAAARPFRHLVIDRFLDPSACGELAAEFPKFDERKAISETGDVGLKAVDSNLAAIGPAYAKFDRLMQDREFLDLLGKITGIPKLIYDPEYIGGGTHENLNGQELDTHVDFNYHPHTQTHRRLNLILFLNPAWDASWGGCLELLRDPWSDDPSVRNGSGAQDLRKEVLPLANRCVIFETTENSWHGFRRIQLPEGLATSRRSIAVYFYTNEAPPQGASPSHATFYFQRPLPDHVQAGSTLSAQDLLEIQTLLARRDQTIQFLYEREKEFSSALASVTGSRAYRLGAALLKPARMLRKLLRGR